MEPQAPIQDSTFTSKLISKRGPCLGIVARRLPFVICKGVSPTIAGTTVEVVVVVEVVEVVEIVDDAVVVVVVVFMGAPFVAGTIRTEQFD